MSETVQSLIDELSKYNPETTVLVEVLLEDGLSAGGHIDGIKQEGSYVVLTHNDRIY